jgi:hypothetical protein
MSKPLNTDESLTKPKQKKDRSEAQQQATQKMLSALEEKKLKLKVLKDKLNNAPPIPDSEPSSEEEPEPVPVPVKAKREPAPVKAKPPKEPKEPKVIYKTDSDSEQEEIVIVKKKKKPKKKTIIYEESESEEEVVEPPPRKSRETKTQQNKASFKVTPGESKPAAPIYYFA